MSTTVPRTSALGPNGITFDGQNDNLFAYDQNATFTSPLFIQSPDKTQTAGIYCNNNGNMVVASDSDGSMYLGSGNGTVLFYSPNQSKAASISSLNNGDLVLIQDLSGTCYLGRGSIAFASADQTKNASLVVENDGDVGFYQAGTGSTLFLGGSSGRVSLANLNSTPLVQIGSSNGTVYDTVYTKPVVQTQVVAESTGAIQLGGANPGFQDVALPSAGYYQFELSAEAITTKAAGTAIDMFCTATDGSSVINFTSNSVSADTIIGGGSGGFVLSSGIFPVNGPQTVRLRMETAVIADGSLAPATWVGTWTIRLTQFGQSL